MKALMVGLSLSLLSLLSKGQTAIPFPTNGGEWYVAYHGTTWQRHSVGLGVAQAWALGTGDVDGKDHIMTSAYLDGSMFRSNLNTYWKTIFDYDGTESLVSRLDANTMYAAGQLGNWSGTTDGWISNYGPIDYYSTEWHTHAVLNDFDPNSIYRSTIFSGTPNWARSFNRGLTDAVVYQRRLAK